MTERLKAEIRFKTPSNPFVLKLGVVNESQAYSFKTPSNPFVLKFQD